MEPAPTRIEPLPSALQALRTGLFRQILAQILRNPLQAALLWLISRTIGRAFAALESLLARFQAGRLALPAAPPVGARPAQAKYRHSAPRAARAPAARLEAAVPATPAASPARIAAPAAMPARRCPHVLRRLCVQRRTPPAFAILRRLPCKASARSIYYEYKTNKTIPYACIRPRIPSVTLPHGNSPVPQRREPP